MADKGPVRLGPLRPHRRGKDGRKALKAAREKHLGELPGAEVEARLEVQVKVASGIDEGVERTVRESCNTLKFDVHGFEVE